METNFFAVKEKLNNAAANCSIDSFISECCIWKNGVGYLDLNVSPIPYLFFEQIQDFVEIVSISFDGRGLRIGFVCA